MKNPTPSPNEAKTEQLQNSIAALEEQIAAVSSKRRIFFLGVIAGLGRAIGATLVFAALVALVSTVLYQLGWFPEFNAYISSFMPDRP